MSRITLVALALAIAVVSLDFARAHPQAQQYGIGRPATPEEIKTRNISVAPDGTGLPPGHGTVEQGREIYNSRCALCHGDRGQGIDSYPTLVGGRGTLASKKPELTVGSYWPYSTTVWDYIHRTMPYQQPGTLSPNETYAVTAYILYMNGIVDGKTDLTQRTLPDVKMPNRDGFIPDTRPDMPERNGKN
jgi:cytochrome c